MNDMKFTTAGDYMTTFEKELQELINRYSKENDSNTPDYVLAHYIKYSLQAFNQATNLREEHFGRKSSELS
jgi:hypothetical protein